MSTMSNLKNKNLDIFMAPILVLLFAALLAMMYGWVGTNRSIGGEMAETPEGRWVASQGPGTVDMGGVTSANPQMSLINAQPPTAQPAHHLPAPVGIGIGNGTNGQMQLINKPTMQAGIGNGVDAQLQLIAQVPVYLGAKFGAVTDPLAASFGLTSTLGLHVQEVAPDTPAAKAGLQMDDILLGIDRQQVRDLDQMRKILSVKQAGDTVKIVYFRHGKQVSGYLTLGTPPDLLPVAANTTLTLAPTLAVPTAAAVQGGTVAGTGPAWLGAEIQNIDAVIKAQFKLASRRGVIISYVTPSSPAAQAGLMEGDVIVQSDKSNIKDVKRFQGLLAELKAGTPMNLRIIRAGQEQDLTLVLGNQALAPPVAPLKLEPAEVEIEASWIGLDVSTLLAKDAEELGFPPGSMGILVNDVAGPPATTVGFQINDLIVAINSTPTLTMRDFVRATKLPKGAVVDVLRGNRHLFVTVPAPGFSQQGTALLTAPKDNFQQVAATQATPGRIAIIVAGPSLGAPVAGDQQPSASLLLVDPVENSFTSMTLPTLDQMQDVIKHNQVVALICSSIADQSATSYAGMGVKIYAGVVGTADQALGMYRTGNLMAMK